MGSMYPSSTSLQGAADLIRQLSDQFKIAINAANIKGHGQHSGSYTSCPGNRLRDQIGTIFALATGASVEPPAPPPGPATGRAVGVVWDRSITASPADPGAVRIPAANITADGKTIGAKGSSAYWELILPIGTHTITGAAPGYEAMSRTVEIRAGQETWASLGLYPIKTASDAPTGGTITVQVMDTSGQPVADSAVVIEGIEIHATNSAALAGFEASAGQELTVTAYGAGRQARTITHIVDGDALVQIALEPDTKDWWTGIIQGVVWDETTSSTPSAPGSQALSGAMILCDCGKSRVVRAQDAFWSFELSAGEYTFTAVAPGYTPDSKVVSVGWGGSEWGSIGITPN